MDPRSGKFSVSHLVRQFSFLPSNTSSEFLTREEVVCRQGVRQEHHTCRNLTRSRSSALPRNPNCGRLVGLLSLPCKPHIDEPEQQKNFSTLAMYPSLHELPIRIPTANWEFRIEKLLSQHASELLLHCRCYLFVEAQPWATNNLQPNQ